MNFRVIKSIDKINKKFLKCNKKKKLLITGLVVLKCNKT